MAYARQFFKGILKKDKVYPWTLAKLVKAPNGGTIEDYLNGTKSVPNAESADKLNNKTLNEIFSMLYPVGTIMEFDRPMNMSATYGGIWELYGTGRMTVGIDTDDADFDTVGKIGGSKEMQKHKHDASSGPAKVAADILRACAGSYNGAGILHNNHIASAPNVLSAASDLPTGSAFPGSNHDHKVYVDYAGTGNAGNMSPYIVVYRYRKVRD